MERNALLDGRLKLRHLNMVKTIADAGSVIRAAEALYVTQPVVTRGLHEIEAILGVPLFTRGPRGVTLTIYGESFVDHARAVLAQLRQAGQQIDLLARAELGSVTVGTHLAGSNSVLPRAIAALKAQHPRLTVVVKEGAPDLLQASLLAGEIDMTVGRLFPTTSRTLAQDSLYQEPVRIITRVDHPVHALARPTLAQLADYPWIFPLEGTALRSEVEESFLHAGVSLPANRMDCNSILTTRQLLLMTDAVAALPKLIGVNDEKLTLVNTKLRSIRRAVGVTYPSDRTMSPAAKSLLGHLRAVATELEGL